MSIYQELTILDDEIMSIYRKEFRKKYFIESNNFNRFYMIFTNDEIEILKANSEIIRNYIYILETKNNA